MCKQCETNSVYEFTNKRKLCRACFIRWFQKKFLYTIRKFKMIDKGDLIGFKNKRYFRDAVLDDLLKMYSERGIVGIVKIRSTSSHQLIAPNKRNSLVSFKLPQIADTLKGTRRRFLNAPTKIALVSLHYV